MTASIGIGVAGLGRMGRIHAENLATHVPGARLTRVADQVPQRGRTTGEELAVAWSTSFEDLLDDPAVEAVVIATPTALHADMTEQAAAAGKHIYCEKPMARELEATVRAVEATRRADVLLQIGFHRRYDPDLARVHDLMGNGEVGEIHVFRALFREMAPPPPDYLRDCGGIFLDAAIHDLDLARWLVGDVSEVTAVAAHDPEGGASENDGLSAALILGFANGALGIVENTRLGGYGYETATEVIGSRATVRAGQAPAGDNVERLAAGSAQRGLQVDFQERFGEAYRLALTGFSDAILAARPATPSGEDAIAALQLVQAAALSAAERRTIRPVLDSRTAR